MITISLRASDVAAYIGRNPYKPCEEVRDELWKKNWPATFTKKTKAEQEREVIAKSSPDSQKALQIAQRFRSSTSEDAQKNYEKARQVIEQDTTLNEKERTCMVEHLRSKCSTSHGIGSENKTARCMPQTGKIRTDNTMYSLPVCEVGNTRFVIWGKVDRIEEMADGSRVLVEIKNRMRGLFKTVREYENIQVQVYLQMLDLPLARLVEQYNSEVHSMDVVRDDILWDTCILPDLQAFCRGLYELAN